MHVLAKAWRDGRRSFVWWSVGLVLLSAYLAAVYPTYERSAGSLQQFFDEAPAALRALFGSVDLASPEGFLWTELFSFMAPLLLAIFAIRVGSGAIAGEESRGTMDLLLANPITRRRVLVEKFTHMAAVTIAVGVVFAAATAIGAAIAGMNIGSWRVGTTMVHCALFAVSLGAVAFAVSAATGSRAAGSGVAAVVGVAGYVVNAFAPLIDWMLPLRRVSFFYYFAGAEPLVRGVSLGHVAALVGASIALLAVSLPAFERRDVAR